MVKDQKALEAAIIHFVELVTGLIHEDINLSKKKKLTDFENGQFFARVTALSTLYHSLEGFGLDPKNLALPDFDPEHFLFNSGKFEKNNQLAV
ncbi:MAG: hypothetical protein A2X86_12835 [Bdellovibrionales bacterium GWA2_49_15]|nr:MAG: hypothetical protein A2X86_12835 [Bdellovibrionales bacterium GWA2_49_15]HAZ14739.1 hypothetical protein [Bdellovibrionales bacterium]